MFIVQDYLLVDQGTDGPSCVTYNHDIVHVRSLVHFDLFPMLALTLLPILSIQPAVKERDGFTRMSIKMQGAVAVRMNAAGGTTKTRLTWLVNAEMNGIIPAARELH